MAMTESERIEHLSKLGLSPNAPGLAAVLDSEAPVVATVDRRTIPASEIVFDPALLDEFSDLTGSNMNAASRKLFDLYKSKDSERNKLLHRRITEFIGKVRTSRLAKTDKPLTESIKVTKSERELAKVLAARGITAESLMTLIQDA